MFDLGSSRLKPYRKAILEEVAHYLETVPNRISIVVMYQAAEEIAQRISIPTAPPAEAAPADASPAPAQVPEPLETQSRSLQ